MILGKSYIESYAFLIFDPEYTAAYVLNLYDGTYYIVAVGGGELGAESVCGGERKYGVSRGSYLRCAALSVALYVKIFVYVTELFDLALFYGYNAANSTLLTLTETCCGASGILTGNYFFGVTECLKLLGVGVATYGAGKGCGACLGTGGLNVYYGLIGVTERKSGVGRIVCATYGTGEGVITPFGTGGSSEALFVFVTFCLDYGLLYYVVANGAMLTVGKTVLHAGCGSTLIGNKGMTKSFALGCATLTGLGSGTGCLCEIMLVRKQVKYLINSGNSFGKFFKLCAGCKAADYCYNENKQCEKL